MGTFCGIEEPSSCSLLVICISFMCKFSAFYLPKNLACLVINNFIYFHDLSKGLCVSSACALGKVLYVAVVAVLHLGKSTCTSQFGIDCSVQTY